MFAMDLYDVADEFERKEADTDGEQNVECGPTDLETYCL